MTTELPLPISEGDLWVEIRTEHTDSVRPALFVDRDGTLIDEVDFLHDPGQVHLIPGAAHALRRAREAGWLVVVVTNQSGVGRGLFRWEDFKAVQEKLLEKLKAEGGSVDAVVACAHHPEGIGRYAHPAHEARKPAPGMILTVASRLPIDLSRSVIVGDRHTDIAAGRAAGLAAGFVVRTGYGAHQWKSALQLETTKFAVRSLRSIAAWRPKPLR